MRILLVPLALIAATLACTGELANMQIVATPYHACPTATAVPTNAPIPTVALPPGFPTLIPAPTLTPAPTSTPHVIAPPDDFGIGDPVLAGAGALRLQLRLLNVQVLPATDNANGDPRNIVTWDLELTNLGTAEYVYFPAGQSWISTIRVAGVDEDGVWGAGQAAADEIGLPFGYESYTLPPGATQTRTLAAYIPEGEPLRFTYMLDPSDNAAPNLINWSRTPNTTC